MRRRKTAIFFLVFGICLSALAVALNVGWIILNLRQAALLVLGVIFFALIITGLILNTIFLTREIRRNEQHDAFLNAVTHELKTPIASIKLHLETLKSREVEPAKREEFYDTMLDDTQRLLGMVEQVLDASRMREGGRIDTSIDVDLADLLTETVALVGRRHHLEPGAFKLSLPHELVLVGGNRDDLQTAFANLLDNAVKYSGPDARVSVRLRPTLAKKAEIFIRDNGPGIAPGELKAIFKRFYRAQSTRGVKGTGLGLAIVKSIIKKHGGRIRAESRGIGRGSTFIIQLPRR